MLNTTSSVQKARKAPPKKAGRSVLTGWAKLKLKSRRDVAGLEAHDLVTQGVSVADAREVLKAFTLIDEKQFYEVLGISGRTMQRRAASAAKTLDSNASDRVLRLVSVTDQAIRVFGSQEAAERWLSSPAIGLDRRKPIELLGSTDGTDLVKALLTRMEYGVYA
ncbi:MAG TPA: antitoxin Xre/MbcA/ParS toxin-binding domain-containing protein [Burkholderiaceae bacterium]|jgi:putative toxin-antitoxin system antitoxin component (TIGR02293 family)